MAFAKAGKVKLGKYMVYQGEIQNKMPVGKGVLYISNPKDKKVNYAEISGDFSGITSIENPQIISSELPSLNIKGSIKVEFYGEVGKMEGLKFTLNKTNAIIEDKEFLLNPLTFEVQLKNDQWVTRTESTPFEWMKKYWENTIFLKSIEKSCQKGAIIGECVTPSIPSILKNNGWVSSHVIEYFGPGNQSIEALTPLLYILQDDCTYTYNEETNKFKNIKSLLSFTINGDNQWEGYRVFGSQNGDYNVVYKKGLDEDILTVRNYTSEDITHIADNMSRDKEPFSSIHPQSSYTGTLKESANICKGNFSGSDIHYLTGECKYDNKKETVKWINGEDESQIKTRLEAEGIDKDLITDYIDGSKTEDEMRGVQTNRNAEKQKQAEQAKNEFHKRWNGTTAIFKGALTGTKQGNEIFRRMFGVDSSYFKGDAEIQLSDNGEAHFIVNATPSAIAFGEGQGRAIQINGFCENINKNVSGTWTIDGNKLLINGTKYDLTINPDNKSITYEGMLGSKMIKQ